MPEVTQYQVAFYGSPEGAANRRAEIIVFQGENQLGSIRFHDPGMTFPNDMRSSTGRITMNLPSAMFSNVLDLLRNERPINYDFTLGRGVLRTSEFEPIGEEE